VITSHKLAAAAALGLVLGAAACQGDFLTGGELSTDPNRPTVATNQQLFVPIQANLWAYWGSDPARITGLFAQEFAGAARQYQALDQTYSVDPTTTNGFHAGLYTGGGLVDIKKLEAGTAALGDKTFLGIAQVMEGALMGTGADIFGNLVYSQALTGITNPKLDDQLAVYDSVQKVLSAAITNLAQTGPTDIGPGPADLVYGGDPTKWTALAHTLKARFYMHTGEVNPSTAYAAALAEAQKGIMSDAGDYDGAFTSASGQENFYYQFEGPAGRGGDMVPGATLVSILKARNDPRLSQYFALDAAGNPIDLSATRLAKDFQQPYVTYDENTLIWAEAAYRTGDQVTALAKLNEERANHGLPAEVVAGQALLNEILTEEYIADFQLGEEAWNLYKRTCTPNLVPHTSAKPIPARLFYDTSEQNTDTNIPPAGTGVNGTRNRNDPPNATSDGTGAACLGQR